MANIYPSIGANFYAQEYASQHYNGDRYRNAWEAAQAFADCADAAVYAFVKSTEYPDAGAGGGPASWGGTDSLCGVRRSLTFFDTTGKSGDFIWRFHNGNDAYGTGYVYILSCNGISPDFGSEVFGAIRVGTHIGTTPSLEEMALGWYEVLIPAAYINSGGYTVLGIVLDFDYTSTYKAGVHGAYIQSFYNSYLYPFLYSETGFIWVEGTKFAYLDYFRTKRLAEGSLTGVTGKTPGHAPIDDIYQYYVDATGAVRRIEGALTELSGKLPSQISINSVQGGRKYCYIDGTGAERCFEGTAV